MDDFLDFMFGGGLQGGAGVGLLTGAYNRLGDIGDRGLELGQSLADTQMEQTAFRPYTIRTPGGSGFVAGPGNQYTLELGERDRGIQSMLQNQAMQYLGGGNRIMGGGGGAAPGPGFASQPPMPVGGTGGPAPGGDGLVYARSDAGGAPSFEAAGQQLLSTGQQQLGQTPFGQGGVRGASGQAFGLGQQFMQQAGMGVGDREAAIYDRMRAAMSPEEERQRLGLEERLAAQGRLGVRTAQYGGTPEQLALSKAQEEARSTAMLGAMQQAQREQAQQAGLGAQFAGLGAGLAGQSQGMDAAQQQLALQAMQGGLGLSQGGLGLRQGELGLDQLRQQLGLGALSASYMPQAQALAALAPGMTAAAMQQQGQLTGAGLFGEATASGIDALLGSALGQANLMGTVGTGLLGGVTQGSSTGGSFLDYIRQALGLSHG